MNSKTQRVCGGGWNWHHGAQAGALMLALLLATAACGAPQTPIKSSPQPVKPAPQADQDVVFEPLVPGVWVHTSFKEMQRWGNVPTNGLIVENGDHSVLVDTAWNDAQTEQIVQWAKRELGKPIQMAVFTHAHEDKMGGVGVLRRQGIKTFAAEDSNTFAAQRGMEPAEHALAFDDAAVSGDVPPLVVFDPGPGHTLDNIVVGIPQAGVLFGGCLIRPGGATSLGNTADGDIEHWDDAVEAAARRFPDAQHVVPSHGPPAGRELLDLTVSLVQARLKKQTEAQPAAK